jgi:hypothetical protein
MKETTVQNQDPETGSVLSGAVVNDATGVGFFGAAAGGGKHIVCLVDTKL